MERKPYDHAEITSRGQFVWSESRLTHRLDDLEETQKVPHSDERKTAIHHEMGCIAFELVQREIDIQKREHELKQLEELYTSERVEDEQRPEDTRN